MNHFLDVSCLFLLCWKVNSRNWDLLAQDPMWAGDAASGVTRNWAELRLELLNWQSLWVQQVMGFCFAGCFVGEQLLWNLQRETHVCPFTLNCFQLCSWAKINGRGRLLLCGLNQLCVGGLNLRAFQKPWSLFCFSHGCLELLQCLKASCCWTGAGPCSKQLWHEVWPWQRNYL